MDSVTIQNPAGQSEGVVLSPMQSLLSNPAIRQLFTLVGMAASVALGVMVILWSRAPNLSMLYSNLSDEQASEIIQSLDSSNIPYELSANGSISVPAKELHQVRMKLAGEGLPSSSGLGLDMLKEDPGFGVSQFIETKRYNHGLETELAQTIAQLDAVKNARVHLALAKESVFVRDRGKTSASVLLDVYAGQRLPNDQVAAIVYFVARSINGLEAEQVTVVDQSGRMLNSPEDSTDYAISANQFEHTQRVEDSYVKSIEDLIAPIVGMGKVRAKVVADLDFTVSEETQERYDPDRTALRSENTSTSERRGDSGAAQGVPGALSNQPPVAGAGAANNQAGGDPGAQAQLNSSRNAVRNFEVDRTVSHTRQASGEIRRLSVAVVIDDRYTTDDEGVTTSAARTTAELEQIGALVREAVGFNAARGDTIQVVNSSFETMALAEPMEAPKFWQNPVFHDIVKQGVGVLLVLLVVFMVLRPMSRGLMQAASAPQIMASATPAMAGGRMLAVEDSIERNSLAGPEQAVPVEQRIDRARKLAADNPESVAQVVKTWVAEGG